MGKNTNGLSRDLIIHPGEILKDILNDREMTQKQLSMRSGISEKHISKVVNGECGISSLFAKKMEYVFGVDASFWINLQAIYDGEVATFEEQNNITQAEISILNNLKLISEHLCNRKLINKPNTKQEHVIEMRSFLGVANLTLIPNIVIGDTCFRIGTAMMDPYVLFTWIKMCEAIIGKTNINNDLNREKLLKNIPNIKQLMFADPEIMQQELIRIFDDCGIAFCIMKHFTGAPVQGFINKINDNISLCMTIRKSYADIFWFTLFHEIAHIINNDFKKQYIDFFDVENECEKNADLLARNMLIPDQAYKIFADTANFTEDAIKVFADSLDVPSYIVVGRLQKEKQIEWSRYTHLKPRYKWND